MYDRMRGELEDLTPTFAVLQVGGISYEIAVPLSTFNALKGEREARLFTHLRVREDEQRLFGFATAQERRFFRLVLSVNGVGPSIGLACLSLLSPEEALQALAAGSAETLQRVKGVGRKLAERLVVELKDRAAALAAVSESQAGQPPSLEEAFVNARLSGLGPVEAEEAVRALVELGFQRKAAQDRVKGAVEANRERPLSLEELIKSCLRQR